MPQNASLFQRDVSFRQTDIVAIIRPHRGQHQVVETLFAGTKWGHTSTFEVLKQAVVFLLISTSFCKAYMLKVWLHKTKIFQLFQSKSIQDQKKKKYKYKVLKTKNFYKECKKDNAMSLQTADREGEIIQEIGVYCWCLNPEVQGGC